MTIITSRRSFIRGAVATLFAAPAIVRCGSLMPVKVMPELPYVPNEVFVYNDVCVSHLHPHIIVFVYNDMRVEMRLAYAITKEAITKNLYDGTFNKIHPGGMLRDVT